MNNPLRQYVKAIERDVIGENATEHTHRPALKVLMESLLPKTRVT